jgi:hypothetical protein
MLVGAQRKSRFIGDARCWSKIPALTGIFRNVLIVKSKNIQYPVTSNQYPVSSIQYQPILAMVFVVTDEIEYIILCNYSVIS